MRHSKEQKTKMPNKRGTFSKKMGMSSESCQIVSTLIEWLLTEIGYLLILNNL